VHKAGAPLMPKTLLIAAVPGFLCKKTISRGKFPCRNLQRLKIIGNREIYA
jgi:hypothetical protein